jgi:hypothetical protein
MFSFAAALGAAALCRTSTTLPREVVIFATGWNGPIDDGDDWHYFDWTRTTTVISMGGRVPTGLVRAGHAAGARIVKGQVLDVDARDASALATWVAEANATVAAAGADGVNILAVRGQRASDGEAADPLGRALAGLRAALGSGAQLSVTLPLPRPGAPAPPPMPWLGHADFVVVTALDGCMGATHPAPNAGLGQLAVSLRQLRSQLPPSQTVVALPWYGWDFRCRTPGEAPTLAVPPATAAAAAGEGGPVSSAPPPSPKQQCLVLPPAHTPATWEGWNLRRSIAYIAAELVGHAAATTAPAFDNSTATWRLEYTDGASTPHVVLFDDPRSLRQKYAACAAARVRGVGVWTADMVSYVGAAQSQHLAQQMWASLDGFSGEAPPAARTRPVPAPAPASAPAAVATAPRLQIHADRLRRRLGLRPNAYIPGYDQCKHSSDLPQPVRPERGAKGCSDGLICLSPLPNLVAQHESGGCYPVRPSISFVSRTIVPPLPRTFRPEEATVYYYLNLVMPDDGNSDVTNSSAGYGFMNQFVPQLELGEALCGSTGAAGGYQTGACSIVDPLRHWVIHSQYFFGVLNHSGVPDPSGVSWTGHAVTGETIPVFPNETVNRLQN